MHAPFMVAHFSAYWPATLEDQEEERGINSGVNKSRRHFFRQKKFFEKTQECRKKEEKEGREDRSKEKRTADKEKDRKKKRKGKITAGKKLLVGKREDSSAAAAFCNSSCGLRAASIRKGKRNGLRRTYTYTTTTTTTTTTSILHTVPLKYYILLLDRVSQRV